MALVHEIYETVRRLGGPGALDCSAIEIANTHLEGISKHTLHELVRGVEDDDVKLGRLLHHPWVAQALSKSGWKTKADKLREDLSRWANAFRKSSSSDVDKRPSLDTLMAVFPAELLDRSVHAMLDDNVFALWNLNAAVHQIPNKVRLRDLLLGNHPPLPHDVTAQMKRMMEAVYQYLARHRGRHVQDVGQKERWSHPPEHSRLVTLGRQLAEFHDALPVRHRPYVLSYVPRLEVLSNPPGIRARCSELEGDLSLRPTEAYTTLRLLGPDSEPLSLQCDCNDWPCRHGPTLVELVRNVVHEPPSDTQDALIEVLSEPPWKRMLAALQDIEFEAGPGKEEQRLAWRLGHNGRRIHMQPMLQRRNQRGGWTPGAKLHPRELWHHGRYLAEIDRRIHDLLGSDDYVPDRRLAQALALLAEHPRVFDLHRPQVPARIYAGEVTARFDTDATGLRLRFLIDGQVWPSEAKVQILDRQWVVAHQEEAWWVGRGSSRLVEMIKVVDQYDCAVPEDALLAVEQLITVLQEETTVTVPEVIRGETVDVQLEPILRLQPEEETATVALMVRPREDGPAYPPGDDPAEIMATEQGRRVTLRRDLEDERIRAERLRIQLGLPEADNYVWEHRASEDVLDILRAAREAGLSVEWPDHEAPWRVRPASPAELRVDVAQGTDWFGIEGGIEIDDQVVSLSRLLDAVKQKQRYVRVAPGQFMFLEQALIDQTADLVGVLFQDKEALGTTMAAIEPLARLSQAGARVQGDAAWRGLRERVERARDLKPRKPRGLQAKLRDYQREGFRWLAKMAAWEAGVCLADEMGLGKTIQTLAMLVLRQKLGPQLVVAPTSVGPNWMKEMARFAPGLQAHLYRGAKRQEILPGLSSKDVVVTSYDIVTLDEDILSTVPWSTLVLDEAQAIKNARTRRARAVRKLQATWRLALTGTPVENHLGDLWSLFDAIHPGLLGSWEHFKNAFATPIEQDGDPERQQALARLVRPFILRRTKAQVALQLPPRTEITRLVEPSAAERALYEAARQDAVHTLLDAKSLADRFQILAAMTRLRRLACHPQLVHPETLATSAKLTAVVEHIEQLEPGERALVFSQFTSYLAMLRAELDARNLDYLYLDGSTPAAQRADYVQRWHTDQPPLFLISLKAGGTGLNLTGADYVLHLDPWWNPAVEDQATDRTHRIGQERPVTVVRWVAQGTIEEAVLRLHDKKRALAQGILEGTEAAAKLSTDALVDLIRFGVPSQHR